MRDKVQQVGAILCLVGGLVLLYWQHDVTNKDQALSIALGL